MKKTKIEPMVNLNVNPCKMCMPMGVVTAFYGLEKCITILHGSQGCSTYIRRHMATHYNEPVDVASSSLTEEGTVYGGESNLIKGLDNLISLYQPEVIGIATTCLAETIGEDVPRIVTKFREAYPQHDKVTLIPVSSPGYGGTQYEGYMQTLTTIVKQITSEVTTEDEAEISSEDIVINVICTPLSPRDIRFIKETFSLFKIKGIFLPDYSNTLDGGFKESFHRLPQGGTSLADVRKMKDAKYTIEITNLDIETSPGKYLEEKFNIPRIQCNIPTGIRDIDNFYQVLAKISEKPIPESINEERSRYVDAMIDSHKYNGSGRALVYGEPDFVLATVRLCVENGIVPLICATGSTNKQMKELLEAEIKPIAKRYFIERFEILDDVDFTIMEEMARKLEANLLIGNSDGRRMEEHLEVPLVRRGFPIHDRVGGQRLRMLGYEGSLQFLDDIANALLSRTEKSFRKNAYDKYYHEPKKVEEVEVKAAEVKVKTAEVDEVKVTEKGGANMVEDQAVLKEQIDEKTKNHPCYNGCATGNARMHLPVAPQCNIQCNYCVRKFDCPNESRPGVTTKVLTPEEAFEKYKVVKEKVKNLTVVGIAGPGDALANFEETKRTLELIREYDKDVTFCLSTNGLMLPKYADELCKLGVSHVTVTMNAVDVTIGAKIYKHVNYNGVRFEGVNAAAILMANQLSGLRLLVAKGIICKVNIVTLKGINDEHIPDIVKKVNEIGCYITNIMPFIQVPGSAFENHPTMSMKEINKIRLACGETMKQMYHCRQCRADAIGTLDEDKSLVFENCHVKNEEKENDEIYRFAISSKSGMLIDQHFGHAQEFYIYEYQNGSAVYKEKRLVKKYCEGQEECEDKDDKIERILETIKDCQGVLTARIGDMPKERLAKANIAVFTTYDRIEDGVKIAAKQMMK